MFNNPRGVDIPMGPRYESMKSMYKDRIEEVQRVREQIERSKDRGLRSFREFYEHLKRFLVATGWGEKRFLVATGWGETSEEQLE